MRFQAPQLGALGVTFTFLRVLQFLSLGTIIGLTANFINEIVTDQEDAPAVLIGTLTVASTATLYIAISYILYYDGLLPLLIAGGFDFLLLIATIIVAVTLGKPISMLSCAALGSGSSSSTSTMTETVVVGYRSIASKAVEYLAFAETDQPHCYEVKAIWGLSIALCVLFAFSAAVCIGLWHRVKGSAATPKDIEGRVVVAGYEGEKGVPLFTPPLAPPHRMRSSGGGGGITGPLALLSPQGYNQQQQSRSLGTGTLLHHGPATSHPTFHHPPPSAPSLQAARAAPVLRSIDEDIAAVPPVPVMLSSQRRLSRGRSLTAQQQLRRSVSMPPIPESPRIITPPAPVATVSMSPVEDYIPIIHKRIPEKIYERVPSPPLSSRDSKEEDDDGYTPITPAPTLASPRSPIERLKSRAAPLLSPRDALGIPVSKIKILRVSRARNAATTDDSDDMMEPLSPSNGLPFAANAQSNPPDKEKPKRRTVWGVLEGWWDLGLLERGKSLRRK
ncbi:hypothetical protein BX600DRAFT_505529 [Xylariales sp. PMI_506]|nr:hypothetical protein BX600DRAFT_505529 [Xylariales sp. PMI_506]